MKLGRVIVTSITMGIGNVIPKREPNVKM